MKLIPLTQGHSALVDDDDYARLSQYKWHLERNRCGLLYARSDEAGHMHRLVLETDSPVIDHEDRNGLNNQRANLRPATQSQNLGNSSHGFNVGTSKFRGVHWDRRGRNWRACISISNRTKWLGRFSSEEAAAAAYDVAAKAHFGEFARLNFETRPGDPRRLLLQPA